MGIVGDILGWLEKFMAGLTPSLNKIVIFFLILFIGFIAGKLLGRMVKRFLKELQVDAFIKRSLNWSFSLESSLGTLTAFLVYFISIILALNAVGLTTIILEVILGIFVLAIMISFLIALKDLIPNAAAGIALRQKLRKGMKLEVGGAAGSVKEVRLLETVIKTKRGDEIVIPNALFTKERITIRKR